MIASMEKAKRFVLMVAFMREIIFMVKNTEKVFINGKMGQFLKEIGLIIVLMEMELLNG